VDRYPSPILFHGPGAEGAARAKVSILGRLLHEPFGDKGLKIAESREIIELMGNPPVGDVPGVLLIGPMDRANRSAQDVLLKSIEEFDDRVVRPVLWAYDEAEVLGTIRSRCLRQWCPGPDQYDEDTLYQARAVVDCSLVGDTAGLIEALKDRDPRAMLEAAARVLAEQGIDEKTSDLWDRVRQTLKHRLPTATETLAVFL
jgi:hypothetical protein